MKTINNITEKELDQLLNRVFLDVDMNSSLNNNLIQSIATNNLVRSHSILQSPRFVLVTVIIMVSVSVALFQIFKNQQNSSLTAVNTKDIAGIVTDSPEKKQIEVPVIPVKRKRNNSEKTESLSVDTTVITNHNTQADSIVSIGTPVTTQEKLITEYQDEERLPVLTEKEIKVNEKEKKKMTRSAIKKEKKKYAAVSNNNSILYIQTAEVTNLEYRTFLFDLLIQGKKDEFLKAKPKQSLWLNAAGTKKFNYLKDDYFTDKQFDNYPVVNISSEGAEMYCLWLTELISKESETYICRLPTNEEWTFAATGNLKGSYPWGTDSIQNTKNRFLANFCIQKMPEKFKQPITYPTAINLNAYTSAGMALNNDSIATAQVYTYNPNNFGLYCMSGNAAEMVKTKDSFIKCKGGSWNSNLEQLKINSEENCDTPSPTIGFRVILKKQG